MLASGAKRLCDDRSSCAIGGDPYLYAFDAATGREVSRVATEYRTSGNPMTYRSHAGRQFILIATGGGTDASLVALSLPPE